MILVSLGFGCRGGALIDLWFHNQGALFGIAAGLSLSSHRGRLPGVVVAAVLLLFPASVHHSPYKYAPVKSAPARFTRSECRGRVLDGPSPLASPPQEAENGL